MMASFEVLSASQAADTLLFSLEDNKEAVETKITIEQLLEQNQPSQSDCLGGKTGQESPRKPLLRC